MEWPIVGRFTIIFSKLMQAKWNKIAGQVWALC